MYVHRLSPLPAASSPLPYTRVDLEIIHGQVILGKDAVKDEERHQLYSG